MTTEQPPSSQSDLAGDLIGNADVTGRVKQKVAHAKDQIAEKANETRGVAVQKAHAAEPAVRKTVTDITGLVKPRVPVVAVIAAAIVIIVVTRRRH